jgi:hypothetical protein
MSGGGVGEVVGGVAVRAEEEGGGMEVSGGDEGEVGGGVGGLVVEEELAGVGADVGGKGGVEGADVIVQWDTHRSSVRGVPEKSLNSLDTTFFFTFWLQYAAKLCILIGREAFLNVKLSFIKPSCLITYIKWLHIAAKCKSWPFAYNST